MVVNHFNQLEKKYFKFYLESVQVLRELKIEKSSITFVFPVNRKNPTFTFRQKPFVDFLQSCDLLLIPFLMTFGWN